MDDTSALATCRSISNDGEQFILRMEGYKLKAYQDIKGIWSIGAGHTGPCTAIGIYAPPYPGMVITDEQAGILLDADLTTAETCVDNHLTILVSDNQFASLVSFTFNEGVGTFASMRMLPALNAGRFASFTAEMLLYYKVTIGSQKVPSPGLLARRRAEVALFNTPDPTHT